MRTIFVTGLPGSGKTTAAGILARRFDLRVANVGDLLAEDLARAGIAFGSRAELGVVFLRHRPSEAILHLIDAAVARGISVFDGVRLFITCEEARTRFAELSIWNVEAPLEHRLERLRTRLHAELGSEEAITRALSAYSLYDEENVVVSKHADVHIENDSTVDAFRVRVEGAFAVPPGGSTDRLVPGRRRLA